MRKRRRSVRHGKAHRKSAKTNFAPVIIILCLSIGCGYATAKYVVEPAVNYLPQLTTKAHESKETEKSSNSSKNEAADQNIIEDEINVKEDGEVSGYALQFGCYSNKAAAEKAMSSIKTEGLHVMEQKGMYKIIGDIFDTKEKAKEALDKLPETEKAFVTTIYE